MKNKFAFVYAVCGSKKYLDELKISFEQLKVLTTHPIYIVTDENRNEYRIDFGSVIHVDIPSNFNNKEASIFLKTSLINYLPKHELFCYLDSDVIAVNTGIQFIFQEYTAPITFADDMCTIDEFSPFSINCNCKEVRDYEEKVLNEYFSNQKIKMRFNIPMKLGWPSKIANAISEFIRNPKGKKDYDFDNFQFVDTNKMTMEKLKCTHLREHLESKFEVLGIEEHFTHWNGGVFLFSEKSKNFLLDWHTKVLEIFADSDWVNRDQGALIASHFNLGLQKSPRLSSKYNCIVSKQESIESLEKNVLFFHFIDGFTDITRRLISK